MATPPNSFDIGLSPAQNLYKPLLSRCLSLCQIKDIVKVPAHVLLTVLLRVASKEAVQFSVEMVVPFVGTWEAMSASPKSWFCR